MSDNPNILFRARRFFVEQATEQKADGDIVEKEIIRHPGAVTILPLLDENRVCLIRNRRLSVAQTLVELPAGTLEKGEDPKACARRELLEETGYRAEQIEPACSFYLSPGILDERMHLFTAAGLSPGEAQLEADEQIENLIVTCKEAIEMAWDGKIQDAKTLIGLWYLARMMQSQ